MPASEIPVSIRALLEHLHPNFWAKNPSSVAAAARLILDLEGELGFAVSAVPVASFSSVTLTWRGGSEAYFDADGPTLSVALFRAVAAAMMDPRCRSAFPPAVLAAAESSRSTADVGERLRTQTDTSSAEPGLDIVVQHLESSKDRVLSVWMAAIRNDDSIPSADRLTVDALRDDFPEMLRELIEYLRKGDRTADSKETRATGASHGKGRWRHGYRLDEVLRELARVRELLLAEIESIEEGAFSSKLRSTVNLTVRRFFDNIAAISARQFIRAQEGELVLRASQLEHAYEQVHAATEDTRSLAESRLSLVRAVNHELRNALQPVAYAAQTLGDEEDSKNRQEISAHLQIVVQRLGTLLDRLGELSTVLAGEAKVHPAPLQLHDFVQRLKDEYASRAEEMGLRFECSVAEHEMELISDPEKLHEIADILLSNAFKYTRSGYVRLEAIEIADHDRWKLRVTDSGVGIDAGRARNLFHEFHSDHTPASEGLHLGLVLGRYLARLLGGDLTYQPGSTGVGSSFELNLPRISPGDSASGGDSP